jgi:serine/threonine-protein kinase
MSHIFISYATGDQAVAMEVCALLEARGSKCWIAPRDVVAGKVWDEAILDAIESASGFLLVLSSAANASPFVKNEVNRAFSLGKPILTFRVEDVQPGRSLELYLARHHWTEGFSGRIEDRVAELSKAIGMLPRPDAAAASVSGGAAPAPIASGGLKPKLRTLSSRRERWAWGVAAGCALLALAALGFAISRSLSPSANGPTSRVAQVDIELPDGHVIGPGSLEPVAISHDGTRLAFVATKDDKSALFVRALAGSEAKRLDGTEGADAPFFSPDDRWIGFFADGKLRKVPVGGGAAQVLAEANFHRGGDWGDDGYIYFAPTNSGSIWRIPDAGGTPTEVSKLDAGKGEISHRWPHRVLGTDILLFSAWTGPGDDETRIAMQSIGTAGHRWLVGGFRARYAAGAGVLAYRYGTQLLTLPWDPSRADLGEAVPAQAAVQPTDGGRNEGSGYFAFAEDGTLAYLRTAGPLTLTEGQLSWIDRAGKVTLLPLPVRRYENVMLSPDGSRAVLQIREGATRLWIYDLARGTLTPLPTGPGSSQAPLWSADSRYVFYRGTRKGTRNLYRIAADGSGEEERLNSKSGVVQNPSSISADGQILLYDESGPDERFEAGAWVLPLSGDRQARRLFPSAVDAQNAHLSPDGRWVAYEATVASRKEIFVAPFGGNGERRLISSDGGVSPLWSPDGRELFFNTPRGLMAVDIGAGGTSLRSTPRLLLAGQFTIRKINPNTNFSISSDGSRFLRIQSVSQDQNIRKIQLVFNWLEAR